MTTIASRLTNTGALLVNGAFDEVSFNTSAPTITNLLRYTEQFDVNTFWIKTRSNIGATNAVVAPDGTLTADKLIEDTTATQSHYINGPSSAAYVTSSSLPVGSIYVKAGERTSCGLAIIRDAGTAFASGTFNVDLSTGTVLSGTGNIASAGNGWYRISTPATTFGANYALRLLLNQSGTTSTYTGDGTSGLYIWGAQLEPGTVATIYQGIAAANTLVTPTWATRTVTDTVYATGQFDEVTYTSGFAKRETQTGNLYVTGRFDEFTGAPVVDGNLKLWLDAGQTTSYSGTGTTWTDLSGSGNNGTLTASPTFDSITGGGTFTFNGSSQYATTTLNSGTISDGTLSAWCYPIASPNSSNFDGIIDGDLPGSYGTGIGVNNGTYQAILNNQFWTTIGQAVTLNQWVMVSMTFTATTAVFYLNGTQAASLTYTRGAVTPGTNYLVGKSAANARYFNGRISTAMVYDRALTADEIAQNFNALRRRYNI